MYKIHLQLSTSQKPRAECRFIRFIQAAHVTTDESKVTCGHCLRLIKNREKVKK